MLNVLVVDDSAVARRLIGRIIDAELDMRVVGEGHDGAEALALVRALEPDVVTMDIRMPVMDGYQATATIMSTNPTPIVMVTAQEPSEIARSFRAVDAGATMVLRKPIGLGAPGADAVARELVDAVRSVAGLRLVTRTPPQGRPAAAGSVRRARARVDAIAIAASTGGPAAVGAILRELPGDLAVPILLVQHIADGFDEGFAAYLDSVTELTVRLACRGELPEPGVVLVAPNGSHMAVTRGGRIHLTADAPINGHRPSASPLFAAVGATYGPHALGVVLTGIGRDGCDGLVELRAAGGWVIAQDEQSSVVWGMPRAVVEAGIADEVRPVDEVAGVIIAACRRGRTAA